MESLIEGLAEGVRLTEGDAARQQREYTEVRIAGEAAERAQRWLNQITGQADETAEGRTTASEVELASETELASKTQVASVDTAAVGDAPNPTDSLGFEPYVRALKGFLTSPNTKPPLTVSLEGEWGSGKSSFMLQLQKCIRSAEPRSDSIMVEFNAWRYEKAESLWAAFALNVIRSVRGQISTVGRLRGNLTLLTQRLDTDQGVYRLLGTGIRLVAIVVVAVAAFLQGARWLHVAPPDPGWWGAAVGLFALVSVSLKKAWQQIGSPFEDDLTKYFDAPDYRGSRAFIESFSDDFAKIVNAYVRKKQRIFVFIDDLDRCEISRAADVLKALNLMLPAGKAAPIVYILGMDREFICSGVAASFEKQLPYLYPTITDSAERSLLSLNLAREYVDKFVQVPFRMPVPTAGTIKNYVVSMTEHDAG